MVAERAQWFRRTFRGVIASEEPLLIRRSLHLASSQGCGTCRSIARHGRFFKWQVWLKGIKLRIIHMYMYLMYWMYWYFDMLSHMTNLFKRVLICYARLTSWFYEEVGCFKPAFPEAFRSFRCCSYHGSFCIMAWTVAKARRENGVSGLGQQAFKAATCSFQPFASP